MWGRGKTKNREDDRNDVGGTLMVEETTGGQGHGDVEEKGWSNKGEMDNGLVLFISSKPRRPY